VHYISPIVFFAYKRLDTTKLSIESLLKCKGVSNTELYVFSDGPKSELDALMVNDVRTYLQSVNGFKNIHLFFSDKNQGLALSIINGVSKLFEKYNSIIVLEDDLIVSPNFIVYMNAALQFYENNVDVFSIAGYNVPTVKDDGYKYDVYFTPRASSWGWASWKDRWVDIDWDITDFNVFKKDAGLKKAFNQGGSDMYKMLRKKMTNEIDSWAIIWCYNQFKKSQVTVYPVISKVQNIGFGDRATNTNVYNRYQIRLEEGLKEDFLFTQFIQLDTNYNNHFKSFYSFRSRLIGKVKTYLLKVGIKLNS
jgi:Glycosyl transferase family 2